MFDWNCSNSFADCRLDWPSEETSHPLSEERVLEAPALVVVIVVGIIVVGLVVARVARVVLSTSSGPSSLPPPTWADITLSQGCPPPCRGLFRGVATPAVLCHKEPARRIQSPSLVLYGIRAPLIGPFRARKPTILNLYAMKNQRMAIKIPLV